MKILKLMNLACWLITALIVNSCASSKQSMRRALEYENQPLILAHEHNCQGGANPVDRLKRNPEKGNCPLCQF